MTCIAIGVRRHLTEGRVSPLFRGPDTGIVVTASWQLVASYTNAQIVLDVGMSHDVQLVAVRFHVLDCPAIYTSCFLLSMTWAQTNPSIEMSPTISQYIVFRLSYD